MKIWSILSRFEKTLLVVAGLALCLTLIAHFQPFTVSNALFLSLDKVAFNTNDPLFAGKDAWIAYFSVFSGGQYLEGTSGYVTSERMESDAGHAKKGFTFSVKNLNDFCDYQFTQQSSIMEYSIIWKRPVWDFILEDRGDACRRDGGDVAVQPIGTEIWCIKKNLVGTKGRISRISERWETQMILAIDGRVPLTETLSSVDQTSASFGDIAQVTWAGSLWTGQMCPSADSLTPILYQNRWRLVRDDAYINYLARRNIMENSLTSCLEGEHTRVRCDGIVLARDINSVTASITSMASSEEKVHQTQRITGDTATVVLRQPISAPTFVLRILADELGITYYLPQPVIDRKRTYCSEINEERSGGVLYVAVKNDKDKAGAITTVVSCGKSEIGGYTPKQVYDKGETKDMSIPLILQQSITEDIQDTCTVTAYASENSAIKDSYSFTCKWKDFVGCTPTARKCSDDSLSVVECNPQGTGWNEVESCVHGCVNNKCRDVPTKCNVASHVGCKDNEICVTDLQLNTYCRELKCKSDEVAKNHQCVAKATYPIIWAIIFAVVGFILAGFLLEPMKIEEARKRVATILLAILFALIPFGLTYAGVILPDIQSGFFTCECTETLPFQLAAMVGIPLNSFMWLLSGGLGLIAGLAVFGLTRNMGLNHIIQSLISLIVAVVVWKTVCAMFFVGILVGGLITVVGLLLVALFPEAVAHWGVRAAKGLR